MATAVATYPAAVEPSDCPQSALSALTTHAQAREHERAWARRFVEQHPERPMILRDTPHRCEILYRLPHLRAWRRAAGWTQVELAYRSGVEVGTISRLERGLGVSGAARISTVERLADALGVENHDLMDRAPIEGERVRPTQRIQAVEAEGAPGDVRFFLHHLWHAVERYAGASGGLDALDALSALAAAVGGGITADELRAVRDVEEPAPWPLVERLARVLNVSALALMDWD